MLKYGIDQSKKFFFNATKLMASVSDANKRVLSRQGATLRRKAMDLIRTGKGASAPGSPPKSHEGTLKRFLFFAYDPRSQSCVVGPAKTNQVFIDGNGKPVTGTVPSILEHGGSIGILEVFKWGNWRRADLRSKRRNDALPTRIRNVEIEARPYMGPALEIESKRFPDLWANAIVQRSAAA